MLLRTLALILALGFASQAPAQGPADMVREISMQNVEIGDALAQLLKTRRYSYIVHPFVDRPINLELKNVRLSDALQKIAGQANAILVYRNRIYEFVLEGDWPRGDAPDEPILPASYLHKVPLAHALQAMHRSTGISYEVEPGVDLHRLVTVASRSQEHWETVWRTVLRQAGATYRAEGGILHVLPIENAPRGPRVDVLTPDTISVTFRRTPFRVAVKAIGIRVGEDFAVKGTVSLLLENKSQQEVLDAIRTQLGDLNRDQPDFEAFFAPSRRPERGLPAETTRRKR